MSDRVSGRVLEWLGDTTPGMYLRHSNHQYHDYYYYYHHTNIIHPPTLYTYFVQNFRHFSIVHVYHHIPPPPASFLNARGRINHKHTEISPMASHSPTWYCFRSLVPTLYIDCRLETFWDQQASLSASASTSTWISSPTGLSHLASSRLASPNPPRALWPRYDSTALALQRSYRQYHI